MVTSLNMWKQLIYYLYKTKGQNGELYDIEGSCTWGDFELRLSDIGYKKGGISKRKRWLDVYISKFEVDKFNKNIEVIKRKKKDFVGLFRFGNVEKKSSLDRVKDFCLIGATFRFQKGVLKKINIYYRTTEIVTKFLADLILLNDFFKVYLTSINVEGVEVGFFFTKIYTRYFHLITFYRVCKKLWNEDVTEKLEKWAGDLLKNMKSGKRQFKFCAAKRLGKSFMENENEAKEV